MAPTIQTEVVYGHRESVGVTILFACSMLSLVSVLGVIIILGVSAVQSRNSSDKTLFVRTKVAKFFVSLLICNLAQGVGGVLNIAWIVENRVYLGVVCTTQAALKQIGNTGPAIFTFVIAVHTFSLLFLRRQWSSRTCYITLAVSWALLLLELCIENFIRAKPMERGPLYGISSYWCWISPKYIIERYTTDYLFMLATAVFSFILYLLVFFRLRGNISVATGYKISFHRRPDFRIRRTSAGIYTVTDDRHVETYLTILAKQMLWYPIVYTILTLPVATARLSTFSNVSVPFPVTIFTAAVFMLHGFLNTVLFSTTRNILPGSWRQRFGLGTRWEGGRGDIDLSSRTNATWPSITTRVTVPTVINVDVEKDVDIKYDTEPGAAYVKFGMPMSPNTPTSPPRAHGGSGKQADTPEHQIQRLSFLAPESTGTSIRSKIVGDDEYSDLSKSEI